MPERYGELAQKAFAAMKELEAGAIAVDEWSQTTVPSIYAIGDVTGEPMP